MRKYLLAIIFFYIPFTCSACFLPSQGYDYSLIELIENTDTIVLATYVKADDKIGFTINETIKSRNGSSDASVERFIDILILLQSIRGKDIHNSIDFNSHSDKTFWENEHVLQQQPVSRSKWHDAACGPSFTFKQDETYLLFPESLGSHFAAEIIKDRNDLWYKYVRKHAKTNH